MGPWLTVYMYIVHPIVPLKIRILQPLQIRPAIQNGKKIMTLNLHFPAKYLSLVETWLSPPYKSNELLQHNYPF